MSDVRRHVPVGRVRAPRLKHGDGAGLRNVSRGRGRHLANDIFERDQSGSGGGNPFRWMLSTLLAAAVSMVVTGVVVYGSLEARQSEPLDLLQEIEHAQREVRPVIPRRRADAGLSWLSPKQDRLQLASSALTLRQMLHEQIRVRRNDRPFLQIKPYVRIATRLAPATRDYADLIPSFNPVRLYAAEPGRKGDGAADRGGFGRVETEVVELLDGTLPEDDGQVLLASEVMQVVKNTIDSDNEAPAVRMGLQQNVIAGLTPDYLVDIGAEPSATTGQSGNVTTLVKSSDPDDANENDLERREVRVLSASDGQSLRALLTSVGVLQWQAEAADEAAAPKLGGASLRAGQEVHVTIAASLQTPGQSDIIKLSVFDEGHTHRVTVRRNSSSEFTSHESPDQDALIRAILGSGGDKAKASLYASIYATSLAQGLTPSQIMRVLRIHAYDTDYRRRLKSGDGLEVFFDLRKTDNGDLEPGELLFTALTSGGDTRRFWRFRSQDGTVDYYNEFGQNARKFLMRKPVRGSNVRLTSGYGMRRHPILNRLRMHSGIDWAAPSGTPILAAGNGVVVEARRRGGNGNFIRLRHANGYQTTYSHLRRFAPGMRPGRRVKQGQLIGFVGTTGLSTGAHLHFEVHVNGRSVDPLKMKVPRERTLRGRELRDFQRERARIMTVLRSPPVRVAGR